MTASADLQLRGTYDQPMLFGHAEVDRGEVMFEGRRYKVTRGTIDFTNPTRIDPFFDVEAETSVRVPYQTYRVTVRAAGTFDRLQQPSFESDPPLPSADVVALLFSVRAAHRAATPKLRALKDPNQTETRHPDDARDAGAGEPVVGGRRQGRRADVRRRHVSADAVASSIRTATTSRVNPSARLTIGKRISDRAYLTFSRSLNSPQLDQIILLEYDATRSVLVGAVAQRGLELRARSSA